MKFWATAGSLILLVACVRGAPAPTKCPAEEYRNWDPVTGKPACLPCPLYDPTKQYYGFDPNSSPLDENGAPTTPFYQIGPIKAMELIASKPDYGYGANQLIFGVMVPLPTPQCDTFVYAYGVYNGANYTTQTDGERDPANSLTFPSSNELFYCEYDAIKCSGFQDASVIYSTSEDVGVTGYPSKLNITILLPDPSIYKITFLAELSDKRAPNPFNPDDSNTAFTASAVVELKAGLVAEPPQAPGAPPAPFQFKVYSTPDIVKFTEWASAVKADWRVVWLAVNAPMPDGKTYVFTNATYDYDEDGKNTPKVQAVYFSDKNWKKVDNATAIDAASIVTSANPSGSGIATGGGYFSFKYTVYPPDVDAYFFAEYNSATDNINITQIIGSAKVTVSRLLSPPLPPPPTSPVEPGILDASSPPPALPSTPSPPNSSSTSIKLVGLALLHAVLCMLIL